MNTALELAGVSAGYGHQLVIRDVSLTVNEVADQADGTCHFSVNIIPHTLTHTTLGDRKPGDRVNLEVDLFARYVARLMEQRR